jgi:hypothetical protein
MLGVKAAQDRVNAQRRRSSRKPYPSIHCQYSTILDFQAVDIVLEPVKRHNRRLRGDIVRDGKL